MTLSELIEHLSMLAEGHDFDEVEVMLADRAIAEGKPKTIFLPEGGCQEYLRGSVAKLLGWR